MCPGTGLFRYKVYTKFIAPTRNNSNYYHRRITLLSPTQYTSSTAKAEVNTKCTYLSKTVVLH